MPMAKEGTGKLKHGFVVLHQLPGVCHVGAHPESTATPSEKGRITEKLQNGGSSSHVGGNSRIRPSLSSFSCCKNSKISGKSFSCSRSICCSVWRNEPQEIKHLLGKKVPAGQSQAFETGGWTMNQRFFYVLLNRWLVQQDGQSFWVARVVSFLS